MHLSNVDFPEPLRPCNTTISPTRVPDKKNSLAEENYRTFIHANVHITEQICAFLDRTFDITQFKNG